MSGGSRQGSEGLTSPLTKSEDCMDKERELRDLEPGRQALGGLWTKELHNRTKCQGATQERLLGRYRSKSVKGAKEIDLCDNKDRASGAEHELQTDGAMPEQVCHNHTIDCVVYHYFSDQETKSQLSIWPKFKW